MNTELESSFWENEVFLVRMKGQCNVAKAVPTLFLVPEDAEAHLHFLQRSVGDYYEVVRVIVSIPKEVYTRVKDSP